MHNTRSSLQEVSAFFPCIHIYILISCTINRGSTSGTLQFGTPLIRRPPFINKRNAIGLRRRGNHFVYNTYINVYTTRYSIYVYYVYISLFAKYMPVKRGTFILLTIIYNGLHFNAYT